MNALDLLVDFTTLISTSVEPMPHQDESTNCCFLSSQDPGTSSLTSKHLSPFRQYRSTQRTPKETRPRNFAANPLSRHILSPSSSHVYDCEMTNDEYQSVPPSSIQHDHRTSHVFNGYHPQDSSVSLPSRPTSIPQQPWSQQSENHSQCAMRYDVDPTLTSVPNTWYEAQTPRAFEPLQHPNAPYQPAQIPCPNPPSQCWTQSPQSYYQAEDAWPPWNTAEPPFDRGFLPEYNEWTLPGTKTEH